MIKKLKKFIDQEKNLKIKSIEEEKFKNSLIEKLNITKYKIDTNYNLNKKYRVIGIDSSFIDCLGLIVYSEFIYNEKNFLINNHEDFINLNHDLSFNKEEFMLNQELYLATRLLNKYKNDIEYLTLIILDGSIFKNSEFNEIYTENIYCITYTSKPNHKDFAKINFIKNINDEEIFQHKLSILERTDWFKSFFNDNILFFYLKMQFEIGRIEKIKNLSLKNESFFLQALYDQIIKGSGYPLILIHTHLKTQKVQDYNIIKNNIIKKIDIPRLKNIYKK